MTSRRKEELVGNVIVAFVWMCDGLLIGWLIWG